MISKQYKKFLSYVIYQVYPRSFNDTNGDGIGDINGVIEKLDYLKELGVNAIWLCPCYKSPNDDNGYDIADYRDIMDEFGTLDDVKRLISEMHKRDMKLIMDLVPNHTSSEHEWFKQSRMSKDNPYSDYYYWFDEPQNDWQSCFCGSAWEYDEQRKQYYLHSYAISQPDLNWENPKVVKEMQDVVDFWVDLGVDGFRCDVIDQISKDWERNSNCFGPQLHDHIHALFGRDKVRHIFTVGECWAGDIDEIVRHSAYERGELTTLFQFDHLACGCTTKFRKKPESLKSVRDIIANWQTLNQERDLIHALFTDNHDNGRFISRMGNDGELRYESATCLAAMFYLLRGVPFIYQGQEFGLTNSHHDTIDEFDDIESVNIYKYFCESMTPEEAIDKINFGSRDNPRRPMSWTAGKNGGFSDAEPWMPLHSRYKEINLETDRQSEKSVFNFYRDILKIRRENDAILYGDFELVSKQEDGNFIFTRTYEGKRFIVICNFEEESEISVETDGKIILSNYGRDTVSGTYRPYEVAIIEE